MNEPIETNNKKDMEKELIFIDHDHYVIVDDSEIKVGDYCLMFDSVGNIFLGNEPKQYLGIEKGHYINKGLKKITHSFGKKLEGVENRSLSEVEELLFGFSIEKMAEKEFPLIDEENLQLLDHRKSYIKGIRDYMKLTKHRFSENDMIHAYVEGTNSGSNYQMLCQDDFEEAESLSEDDYEEFKRTLSTKTKWTVEYINNKLSFKQLGF